MTMLTDEKYLQILVRTAAETYEMTCDRPFVPDSLRRIWLSYEHDVLAALRYWARSHVRPHPLKWATTVFQEGDAPMLVWFTLTEAGVGIWDGSWDRFVQNDDNVLKSLRGTLEVRLGHWVPRIEDALLEAARECSRVVDLRRERWRRGL